MKNKEINIEKFISVDDVKEIRGYLETASRNDCNQLLTYISIDIFSSLRRRRYSLDKLENLYHNIYTSLVKFFAVNLASNT